MFHCVAIEFDLCYLNTTLLTIATLSACTNHYLIPSVAPNLHILSHILARPLHRLSYAPIGGISADSSNTLLLKLIIYFPLFVKIYKSSVFCHERFP